MKINVRNEPAVLTEDDKHEARTCIWVVGDDGETTSTKYLEGDQEISIDETVFGKPDQVSPAAATADEQARAHIATLLRRPEVSPEDRAAAEAFLKDQGGVQAAAEPVEPGAEAEQ